MMMIQKGAGITINETRLFSLPPDVPLQLLSKTVPVEVRVASYLYRLSRPEPPHARVLLPLQGILHPRAIGSLDPALVAEVRVVGREAAPKHSPEYSTPQYVRPFAVHDAKHVATVLVEPDWRVVPSVRGLTVSTTQSWKTHLPCDWTVKSFCCHFLSWTMESLLLPPHVWLAAPAHAVVQPVWPLPAAAPGLRM